jgi:hypothetical protein
VKPVANIKQSNVLQYGRAPADAADLVLAFVRNPRLGTPGRGQVANKGSLQVGPPLALYSLSLEDLAGNRGLSAAVPMNRWQFVIESAGTAVMLASVLTDASGASQMATVGGGGKIEIAGALDDLATQLTSGGYEVRLLQLPGGLRSSTPFEVIWLKSLTDANDLIYPYEALYPSSKLESVLQNGKLYPANELLKALQPLAEQQLQNQSATTSQLEG